MKILHIVEIGKRANGIGTVVEHLYKEQLQLGQDVRIVTINQNIAYQHLEIITCISQKEFDDFIFQWHPDTVLFHSIWAMQYIKFAKSLKRQQIPYAIMLHGADSKVNRQSAPFKKWLVNTLWFNRFMHDAKALIFLSKEEENNCLSAKKNKTTVVIPNGCDKREFSEDRLCHNEPINIIFLGRFAKFHKGIDVLLDALEILKTQGYNGATVRFYGNKNDIDFQYLKDRLPALKGIATYCGRVYGPEKEQVLQDADALILTSRFEGMPMSVLEALSYGVPCILTPGTNMAEDIESSGAGWKAQFNPQSVADTIVQAGYELRRNYVYYHKAAYTLSLKYDWRESAVRHVRLMEKITKL